MIRVGTRGSALALAQTRAIAALFDDEVEIVEITTRGDTDRASLSTIGGQGVFATALRDALRQGRVDVAVHSMKDLPTAPAPGITLAAVSEREDALDALCAAAGRTLADLPAGARIGTGSPRRLAQLRRLRPDLELVDIRGNVPTRLDRTLGAEADLDAVVLAMAGLNRLGLADRVSEQLGLAEFPTAAGQGALAIEVREDDERSAAAVAPAESPLTRLATAAERGVLAGLDAGCTAPMAVHARVEGDRLRVDARVYSPTGDTMLASVHEAPATPEGAVEAASECVTDLLEAGAGDLVQA